MKWTLVTEGGEDGLSLDGALNAACDGLDLDRLDVAVAYATVQGVKALGMAVGGMPPKSRWVIGLDDAISQPEAIECLLNTAGAEVRLARMAPERRFHPKLYCLWSSVKEDRCISAIGSGNMTLNGLRSNGETAVILSAESIIEAQTLREQWDAMWRLGFDATPDAMDEYRKLHIVARKQRKKLVEIGVAPPEPEPDASIEDEPSYNGNPASAKVAWLEAGSPSAGGRDLEFPKAMMPFFDLKNGRENRLFRMPNGQDFELTFTERKDNQMWRLLFSSASIQAAVARDTLRPDSGGNRSDLAIVFRKTEQSQRYDVTIVLIGSAEYQNIIQKSENVQGGPFNTRNPGGRKFGFY